MRLARAGASLAARFGAAGAREVVVMWLFRRWACPAPRLAFQLSSVARTSSVARPGSVIGGRFCRPSSNQAGQQIQNP
jgi:hypothetical protein